MHQFTIYLLLFFFHFFPGSEEPIIIDSSLTFREAVKGKDIPVSIISTLSLIDVEYYSFDGKLHIGQLIIHKDLVKDVSELFQFIKKEKFPVEKVVPISAYNWDDDSSMQDNNTSAFNYRVVKGTKKLSAHSTGRAIDINPLLNPQLKRGKVFPHSAEYDTNQPGTLFNNHLLVKEFKKKGWRWGGNWRSTKDYQHFEK